MEMRETGVAVWHRPSKEWVYFIPCPGEKRVRIDVFDDRDNYEVRPVTYNADGNFNYHNEPALKDWQIDWT